MNFSIAGRSLTIRKKHVVVISLAALLVALAVVFAVSKLRDSLHQTNSNQPPFDGFRLNDLVSLPATSVKVQGMSGTCWSFAGISFLESELIRQTGQEYDLSEMFPVRQAYFEKARNYILRQGTARFTEGELLV